MNLLLYTGCTGKWDLRPGSLFISDNEQNRLKQTSWITNTTTMIINGQLLHPLLVSEPLSWEFLICEITPLDPWPRQSPNLSNLNNSFDSMEINKYVSINERNQSWLTDWLTDWLLISFVSTQVFINFPTTFGPVLFSWYVKYASFYLDLFHYILALPAGRLNSLGERGSGVWR